VGRWETTEADSVNRPIWEFTEDGRVKGFSGPEVGLGTYIFLNGDTLEIAWDDMEMEKVTFKISITEHELERRVVSINLGDGALSAEGPVTIMRRATR
jgi:hypothetical protein